MGLSGDSQCSSTHCCVSIGVVFFTGIGGDINLASWARYKFIERFRLLYSQLSRGHQNTRNSRNSQRQPQPSPTRRGV